MSDNEIKKEMTEMNEVELYFLIEGAGGFIWRMNHEMSHGRIPEESIAGVNRDIENVRQQQLEAIKELPRIGIAKPLEENGTATPEYWTWYRKWNAWHHNMTDDQWNAVNASLMTLTDEQVAQYHQEVETMFEAAKAAKEKAEAEAAAVPQHECQGCGLRDIDPEFYILPSVIPGQPSFLDFEPALITAKSNDGEVPVKFTWHGHKQHFTILK